MQLLYLALGPEEREGPVHEAPKQNDGVIVNHGSRTEDRAEELVNGWIRQRVSDAPEN